jgi:hypothetical protein
MFLIMINDLPNVLHNSNCLLFADDCKIYKEITCEEDCLGLQADLRNLEIWCAENKLELNVPKCHYITFTLKKNPIHFEYALNGSPLSESSVIRDLGVWYDKELRFEYHINVKVNEGYKMSGFIKRTCKQFKNQNSVKILYNSFVRPKVEYASLIWSPIYENQIRAIEKVQKKFFRYLYFKFHQPSPPTYDPYRVPYVQTLTVLCELSLEERRTIQEAVFVKRLIDGIEDNPFILSLLPFMCSARNTRNSSVFYLPSISTNIAKKSPVFKCCRSVNHFDHLDIFFEKTKTYKNKCCKMFLGLRGQT